KGQKGQNNRKARAGAMHNHQAATRHFPPPVVYGKDGKALYSWRVLLLPYLEAEAVYKEFKLDEPWDSDHNKKLLSKMPKYFAPLDIDADKGLTYYQVFVGTGAAFEDKQSLRIASFTDGTANTILIAEGGQAVPWTKPVDLPYVADKALPKLGGQFKEGFYTALADGSVRFFKKDIAEKALRTWITRNGGEINEG